MSNRYRYERMKPEHAETVRLLELLCLGVAQGTIADLEHWLSLPGRLGIVALRHGKVVGHLLYQLQRAGQTSPSKITLCNLAVHPDHRRQGIATAFLRGADAAAAQTGSELHAALREDWLSAQLLLRTRGYHCHLIDKRASPTGYDVYRFRKLVRTTIDAG